MGYRRWLDWLEESRDDLEAAETLLKDGRYSKACFLSQQAAEKAVKALIIHRLKIFETIHSVAELLRKINAPEEMIQLGVELDRHYIPSRYPNAWPSGAPSKMYRKADAESALNTAKKVLEYVKGEIEPGH